MSSPSSPAIQRAFVLGAGLGTRLKSLTADMPKPLIPVCQKPLITFAFDHLIALGVRDFVVNTHHRAEAYARAFPNSTYRNCAIQFSHEPELLETGGGIKKIEHLIGDQPFIVYNGDILTDLPIQKAIDAHFANRNEITLVLRSKDGPLQIALDETTGEIIDIGNRLDTDAPGTHLFTGITIVDPKFFARIPADTKISVIPIFTQMIRAGDRIGGVVIDEGYWWDLGTREQYLAAHHRLFENPPPAASDLEWIHPTAQIAPTAEILGATVIGARAKVGAHAKLIDSVLWENADVQAGSELTRCIVLANHQVSGEHTDADLT